MPHDDAKVSSQESLPTIQYPAHWSKPKFALGDRVYPACINNPWLFWGHITGLEYAEWSQAWICLVNICDESELLSASNISTPLLKQWNQWELRHCDEVLYRDLKS